MAKIDSRKIVRLLAFVQVRWGNVRNWRALLSGTVWQRDGAARWTEASWQREVIVVVRSYKIAQRRTILRVREVALLLLCGVCLLRIAANLCSARTRPVIMHWWD